MNFEIVAVHDAAARIFLTPFFVVHVDVACRSFSDIANDPSAAVGKNPEDYTLYHLGQWDDDKAGFVLFPQPVHLGNATHFLKGQRNVQH